MRPQQFAEEDMLEVGSIKELEEASMRPQQFAEEDPLIFLAETLISAASMRPQQFAEEDPGPTIRPAHEWRLQ